MNNLLRENLYLIFLLLYSFPIFSQEIGIKGNISFPEDNSFWSVFHFYEDKLNREIKIIASNPEKKEVVYLIRIFKGEEKILEKSLGKSASFDFRHILEIPLISNKQRIELLVKFPDKEYLIAKKILNSENIFKKLNLKITPKIEPLDYEKFLLAKDKLLTTKDHHLLLNWQIIWLGEGEKKLLATFSLDKLGALPFKSENIILKEGKLFNLKWDLFNLGIPLGKHKIYFQLKDEKELNICEERELILTASALKNKQFGAFWTDIEYESPVYIFQKEGNFEKKDWKELWKNSPLSDVIVNFPQGFKFLFWKGFSYIPCWAIENIGLTYEWVEAQGGWGERAKIVNDCVEPLQDKECRYSRVKIISSTDARAIIHWRYAECDLDYKIIDDEWIDEYYYFYPDGFGTRKVFAWIKPNNWHEVNEFIVLLPPGINPFEVISKRGITILNTSGEKTELFYPKPSLKWDWGKPAIFRVHLKNNLTPVLVTNEFLGYEAIYDGWQIAKRYICPSYWGHHWPITRGHPTCQGPPNLWKEGPTHASLLSPKHKPISRELGKEKECVVWAWLIGITDSSDKELLSIADNWLNPAELKVISGGKSLGYDQTQRAYRIKISSKTKEIKLVLNPKKNQIVINPAFLLENFHHQKLDIKINHKNIKDTQFKFGLEKDFSQTNAIIWLNLTFKNKTLISFSFK